MTYPANTPDEYIALLPEERKAPVMRLREVIQQNIPAGFEETISYGMIGWVVPKTIYPDGYHCDKSLPLPFLSIASQKNFVALYHMGLYADPVLMDWFLQEYAVISPKKPDMGKSCIRFKKPEEIPFELIERLSSKMTCRQWIDLYESQFKK
jgi:uncharacterized protein YdhG (YjbR/CyaY superfamily)